MVHLTEILQDDGDVHVDNDQECHDEVRDEVDYRQAPVATVAVRLLRRVGSVTARLFIVHEAGQDAVPAS